MIAYMLSENVILKVVLDTNIFVSAVLSPDGGAREILRMALNGAIKPIFGNALLSEYEDVLGRNSIFEHAKISQQERQVLFEALLNSCQWSRVHFLWRPNLRDENDNHVLELGVASGAHSIVTSNVRDFSGSELAFPHLRVLTPGEFLNWRRAK